MALPNTGKMVLLDKLLPKLKERDSRVLIFSQVGYLGHVFSLSLYLSLSYSLNVYFCLLQFSFMR